MHGFGAEAAMYWGWTFWGMHLLWWLFWVVMLVAFFSLLTPVPRAQRQRERLTPLEILKRRYANGELSTAEYDERKRVLERDEHPPALRPPVEEPRPSPDRPLTPQTH
jgi:putative membrane protein